MGKDIVELWGREFNIVKNGLSEAQIVSFVDDLISEHDMLIQRQEHLSSLTKLAERTVAESEKLAEETKKEAIEQAKAEAAKIVAEADERANQITEEKRHKIMAEATEQAEVIKAKAEREAELLLDRQRERIESDLKGVVQGLYSQLLSQLDNLKEQVVAMEKEFEQGSLLTVELASATAVDKEVPSTEALASMTEESEPTPDTGPEEELPAVSSQEQVITEQTSEIEEALVSGNHEAPATYEEKVELEFPSPASIMQIVEIDKYLESLPQVEATEIVPITDRPVITVFLRESMELTDILSQLPEVSELKEETNGEVSATGEGAEGKSRKIQITLSGNIDTDEAEG